MERLKSGDARALGPLFERYGGVVSAVIAHQRSGIGRDEVDDVCQETFLTLMEISHRYRPGNTLRGWLCGIALKKSRRLQQGRWLREGLLARFARPKQVAFSAATPSEQRMDLERMLDKLSPALGQVAVLSLVEQLDPEEVAQALEINVNAVWVRLHRARERIRELMEGDP